MKNNCGDLHFACCDHCFNQNKEDGCCDADDYVERSLKIASDKVLCGMFNKKPNVLACSTATAFGFFDENGLFDKDCCGLMIINGLNFGQCVEIEGGLKDSFDDFFKPEKAQRGMIECILKNIYYDEGQQSFPETGQWDYLPYYGYDIEITKIRYF